MDQMAVCNLNDSAVDCRLFDPQYAPGWWANLMKVGGMKGYSLSWGDSSGY